MNEQVSAITGIQVQPNWKFSKLRNLWYPKTYNEYESLNPFKKINIQAERPTDFRTYKNKRDINYVEN